MRITGMTEAQFLTALAAFNELKHTSIHVTEYGSWKNRGLSTGGTKRPWIQGQLKVRTVNDRYHRRRIHNYHNPEKAPGRMPFVCWHGYRDLFRYLYVLYPDLTIRAGQTVYRSLEHFEQTYLETDRNIGSQYEPVQYSDACDCEGLWNDALQIQPRVEQSPHHIMYCHDCGRVGEHEVNCYQLTATKG